MLWGVCLKPCSWPALELRKGCLHPLCLVCSVKSHKHGLWSTFVWCEGKVPRAAASAWLRSLENDHSCLSPCHHRRKIYAFTSLLCSRLPRLSAHLSGFHSAISQSVPCYPVRCMSACLWSLSKRGSRRQIKSLATPL